MLIWAGFETRFFSMNKSAALPGAWKSSSSKQPARLHAAAIAEAVRTGKLGCVASV